jgi:uncharacterized protein involved in exopolysaccharide biosynthesis
METAGQTARTAAPPAAPAVNPTVDLYGLVEMAFRRKWLILGTAATVVALAFLALTVIGPRYKATARILIDPREVRVVQNELIQQSVGNDLVLLESQVEVITSETVLMRVVRQEKLADDPEFVKPSRSGTETARSPEEVALESLARATKVSRAENTYVIEIAVTTKEPAKSARLANAIAAAYTADQQDATARATRTVSNSIEDRLAELQKKLREDEQKVQEYKAKNDLSNPDGKPLLDGRLNDLSTRLAAAVSRTAEAKSRLEVIEQAMRQRGDVSSVVSDTENTTMVQLRNQLSDAQRKLAELTQTLGPRHPQVAAAQAQVDQARQAIRNESERLVAATRDAWRAASETEQAIAASLKELTGQSFDANQKMIQLRELERQAQASRLVYEAFLVRAKEAAEQENISARNARIIAPAAIPDRPAFPPRNLLLLASGVFGLGLGIFNAIVADMLARQPVAPWRRREKPAKAEAAAPAGGGLGEVGDILRGKVVLTLSLTDPAAAREAGLELARDAARGGHATLFVDLGHEDAKPGFAELSTGEVSIGEVLARDDASPAHVIHGGDPAKGFADAEFRNAFGVFLDTYERVVVNAGLLSDAAGDMAAEAVANADHAVLVVADETPTAEEEAAYRELAASGGMTVSVLSLADEPQREAA